MKRKFSRLLLPLFICGFFTTSVRSQGSWEEIRGFGINSYTTTTIRTLAMDHEYKVIFAAIGKEVYCWRGGNSQWEPISTTVPLNADGIIHTIATDRSHNTYAAGAFSNQNGRYYVAKAVYNTPMFGKFTWTELGGTNALNASGPIYSVITDAAGNVYAAGTFFSTTGSRYVAKWNGSSWSELGTSAAALKANNYIYTLCTDSVGNIYAAGEFTNAAGKRYVAKWNGSTWSELGAGGDALNASASIRSIGCDKNGMIYAAGNFVNAAGKSYVAKWNGTSWSELGAGTGPLSANGDIYTLSIDLSANVYAAGNFTNAGGKRYVAKWNGTAWSELGSGAGQNANEAIYATAIDNKSGFRLYAAGDFTNHNGFNFVQDYNGATGLWTETAASAVGTIAADNVSRILTGISTDTLYALGCFFDANTSNALAKWNGTGWSFMPNSNYCLSGLVIDSKGNMYGSGKFGGYSDYVSKWSGNGWVNLGNSRTYFQSMDPYASITAMVTDSAGNIYATGYYKNAQQKYFVAWWNGVSWGELGTGTNSLASNEYLSGLTIDAGGNIYVCAYKNFEWHIAKWNGTSWTFLESAPARADLSLNRINSIAVDNNGFVYSTFDNFSGNYFRKWDGSKWTILSPFNSASFIIDKNNNFYTLLGTSIQTWNGTSWTNFSALPANFRAKKFLNTDRNGNLYTIGSWDNGATYGVARYRGSAGVAICNPSGNTGFTNPVTSSTYQWQVSTDGTIFTDVANNTNYTGATSQTLQVNNAPSSWYGYQYRCVANGFTSNVFVLKFGTTWIGEGTDETTRSWQNAANWSCGVVPDLNTDVIIPGGTVVVTGNAFCGSLTVGKGANVTLNTGANLTIKR